MDKVFTAIETLILEKKNSFTDLVELLKEERKSIDTMDVESLWRFSTEKQKIASRIEGIRDKILCAFERLGVEHKMDRDTFSISKIFSLLPTESRKNLSGVNAELILLRKEIHSLASESRTHVENCLGAVNDLFNIVTKEAEPKAGYGRGYARTTERQNLFIHSEV